MKGDPPSVALDWWARVSEPSVRRPVRQMYKGRAFAEALRAVDVIKGDLWIVSAGLGLIAPDQPIPAYSLTISSGAEDSILPKTGCSPNEWWRELIAVSGNQALPDAGLILFALSAPYLEMIGEDLRKLTRQGRSQIRIFCGTAPQDLDPELWPFLMPYDARFDAIGGPNPGTQADFAQRALRHFVEAILATMPDGTAAQHAEAIEAALSKFTKRPRPNRTRLSDEAIIDLIRKDLGLRSVRGRSGPMLRYLRDEREVACEQGRFKALFLEATAKGRAL